MDSNNKNYYKKIDEVNDDLQKCSYNYDKSCFSKEELSFLYDGISPGLPISSTTDCQNSVGVIWSDVVEGSVPDLRSEYEKCKNKNSSGLDSLIEQNQKQNAVDELLRLSGIELNGGIKDILNEVKDMRSLALKVATLADHLEAKISKFSREFETH